MTSGRRTGQPLSRINAGEDKNTLTMASDDPPTLRVPGVNMPVDVIPSYEIFPSALVPHWEDGSWASYGVTLRELRMMAFINDITDKPEWERKVFDEAIVEKWRAEASEQPEHLDGDVVLSEQMFDFVGFLLCGECSLLGSAG